MNLQNFSHAQLAGALIAAINHSSPHEAAVDVSQLIGGSLDELERKALAGMLSDVLAMVRQARR